MKTNQFSLNSSDIHKALLDGIKGATSVIVTAATYLIAHPELLGPSTVWTTLALAALPIVVSLASRWVAPSAPEEK